MLARSSRISVRCLTILMTPRLSWATATEKRGGQGYSSLPTTGLHGEERLADPRPKKHGTSLARSVRPPAKLAISASLAAWALA